MNGIVGINDCNHVIWMARRGRIACPPACQRRILIVPPIRPFPECTTAFKRVCGHSAALGTDERCPVGVFWSDSAIVGRSHWYP